LITFILGLSIIDSKIFILIFKFSSINSVLFELFAKIPPTLAAALMITSGLVTLILFEVSSYENKFVSSLVEGIIVISLFLSRTLFNDLPTKPLLPKIKTLIIFPQF